MTGVTEIQLHVIEDLNLLCFSWLTKSITFNGDFQENGIVLEVVPGLDFFVFSEFCTTKAGVFLQFWSSKEWLVLWTGVGFDGELDVFPMCVVVVLIQQVKRDSIVERPF